ncbi:MAG: lipid asymmetry maintenance protein MlaB [Succinivibrio sp.]
MQKLLNLNFDTVPKLWNERDTIFAHDTLDLSELETADASGIAFLVKWSKSRSSVSKLKLIHVPVFMMNLINTYKVNELFEIER